LPGWKRWIYCNGLREAGPLWYRVFDKYTTEMDHTILECLAYNKNSEIIINYLEKKLPEIFVKHLDKLSYHQLKLTDPIEALIANIFFSTIAKNAKFMLKDTLNNFQKIKYR